MSCEDLICARCAGPVVEARCPACRNARAEVHLPLGLGKPQLMVVLLAVLLALTALLTLQVAQ